MSVNGDVTDVIVDEEDFYHVLGVTRDASEKQINIAFKKLALKYHPDRNVDDEYAAVKFKAVNDAFHVLNDPIKRRAYDQRYEKTSPSTSTEVTLSSGSDVATTEGNSLTGIGRVFGAVISRFGINTQISQDIMATAQAICRNGGIEGGGPPLDQRVSDLPWGWAAEAKVDRQTAAYYRLTADPQHTEIGFIIHGRSVSKGKFKMVLFDKDGTVMHQVDSSKDKDANYTQATFFFTNFDTYHLGEATTVAPPAQQSPLLAAAEKDKSYPPVLSRLETFTHSSRKIASGQYLLCVYGDNLFGKTAFSIIAVPAKMDSPEVRGLEELDEILLESKRSLAHLKTEYILAKAAYERVLEKISATEDKLDGDVSRREKFYTGFIDASIREFSPMSTDFESIIQQQVSGSIPIPGVGSAHGSMNTAQFSSSPPTASSLSGAVSLLGAVGKSVSATGLGNSSSHANTQQSHKHSTTTSSAAPSSVAGDDVHTGEGSGTTGGSSGVLGYLTTNTINVASNAASVTTNAAQTATAAGGWIARRFSLGIQSIVKIPVSAHDPHADELGVSSDDSISVPDRVMSPDGFSTVMSSPPNETDNYFDAAPIPDSTPASPSSTARPFQGSAVNTAGRNTVVNNNAVVSLQAAATAAAAAVAAEEEQRKQQELQQQEVPQSPPSAEAETTPVTAISNNDQSNDSGKLSTIDEETSGDLSPVATAGNHQPLNEESEVLTNTNTNDEASAVEEASS